MGCHSTADSDEQEMKAFACVPLLRATPKDLTLAENKKLVRQRNSIPKLVSFSIAFMNYMTCSYSTSVWEEVDCSTVVTALLIHSQNSTKTSFPEFCTTSQKFFPTSTFTGLLSQSSGISSLLKLG